MLRHGILGLLSYGEMTGYSIMAVFRDSLDFIWSASTSQIYRELQTLKEQGFVTAQTVPQSGKPDKVLFSITDSGRQELLCWLREEDGRKPRFPLLMKTFFAGELPAEENITMFESVMLDCDTFLSDLHEASANLPIYTDKVNDKEKTLYWKFAMDFRVRYTKMMREWAQTCIETLKEE